MVHRFLESKRRESGMFSAMPIHVLTSEYALRTSTLRLSIVRDCIEGVESIELHCGEHVTVRLGTWCTCRLALRSLETGRINFAALFAQANPHYVSFPENL
jgi:hypothetical protein